MTRLFLNGAGMTGGPLNHQLQGAPLLTRTHSAEKYRFYSVADKFPAMQEVETNGHKVAGEVYEVPLETLRNHLLPAEPNELELGIIELEDGTAALATVLRKDIANTQELTDISTIGDWRQYLKTK